MPPDTRISTDPCILTTKDFTILEVMLDRCTQRESIMGILLRSKIDNARVFFSEDIASAVATIGSRICYRINDRETDSRILSHDRMAGSAGLFLPITSAVGLALLGLEEGQQLTFMTEDGEKRVRLESVLYQPEHARRERDAMARMATPAMRRKAMHLVRSDYSGDN